MSSSERVSIVTHSSGFHTDDVFSVAFLLLKLGPENCEVVRTRDSQKISQADWVVDVGGVYDPSTKRFDHHQEGRAGKRGNGIYYSSFGLLWKHFGEEFAGSKEAASDFEKRVVIPIDAFDNGQPLFKPVVQGVIPYTIDYAIDSFYPTRHESDKSLDDIFMDLVYAAQKVIEREVKQSIETVEDEAKVISAYKDSEDKRILVMDQRYSWSKPVIEKLKDVLFVIYPRFADDGLDRWNIMTVQENHPFSYEKRRSLPAEWAGKKGEELVQVTGVDDAIFCHDGLFMAAAASKEGAIKLAKLALDYGE